MGSTSQKTGVISCHCKAWAGTKVNAGNDDPHHAAPRAPFISSATVLLQHRTITPLPRNGEFCLQFVYEGTWSASQRSSISPIRFSRRRGHRRGHLPTCRISLKAGGPPKTARSLGLLCHSVNRSPVKVAGMCREPPGCPRRISDIDLCQKPLWPVYGQSLTYPVHAVVG